MKNYHSKDPKIKPVGSISIGRNLKTLLKSIKKPVNKGNKS